MEFYTKAGTKDGTITSDLFMYTRSATPFKLECESDMVTREQLVSYVSGEFKHVYVSSAYLFALIPALFLLCCTSCFTCSEAYEGTFICGFMAKFVGLMGIMLFLF